MPAKSPRKYIGEIFVREIHGAKDELLSQRYMNAESAPYSNTMTYNDSFVQANIHGKKAFVSVNKDTYNILAAIFDDFLKDVTNLPQELIKSALDAQICANYERRLNKLQYKLKPAVKDKIMAARTKTYKYLSMMRHLINDNIPMILFCITNTAYTVGHKQYDLDPAAYENWDHKNYFKSKIENAAIEAHAAFGNNFSDLFAMIWLMFVKTYAEYEFLRAWYDHTPVNKKSTLAFLHMSKFSHEILDKLETISNFTYT